MRTGWMWAAICGTTLWAGSHETWVATLGVADRAQAQARFQEAADSLKLAAGIAERLVHADVLLAQTLTRLGSVYADMGRLRDAENADLRALAAWERGDPADPERSNALMGLVRVYMELREFAKAERFGSAAIQIREKAWGPSHSDVGAAYVNLAAVYHYERRYPQALEMYQRAIEILSKSGGFEDAATVRGNLGTLLGAMGRPADAVAEIRQAIATLEVLGPRLRPKLALLLNNLALMDCRMGRWDEAEAAVLRAREIITGVFGPDHSSLGPVLRTYADVLRHTGRKREARQMERSAAALRQEAAAQNLTGYTVDAKAYIP
ncbi:hypothetical protein SBA4_6970007 [Candidatus Sulfopaludibacter sp. SbA4]|nr:hypothetical protein SBA4_6970007 [Candidatus Sulfopaludibacter sp. SbA4]